MQRVLQAYVGCAGWSLTGSMKERFPGSGSHLERHASRLPAVEIDSSFYRRHKPSTYARWAASVPVSFRFAVKVPRAMTHEARLSGALRIDEILLDVGELGSKLGPLLVQLPPSLAFERSTAAGFFQALRKQFDGDLVCEPRHPSWFAADVDGILQEYSVARVAADPAAVPSGAEPGGWPGLVYYRLHGSPRRYHSAYSEEYVQKLSRQLALHARSTPTWCIFDNTAEGAALANALDLWQRLCG
jgi:uncharacterized protein YecE (DUF72 family)